jgi:hypothetical protein
MQLKEYLKSKNYTQMSFIKEIENERNVRIPQGTLAKWITGVRIPRKKEMILLVEVTDGKVQPNDFYM